MDFGGPWRHWILALILALLVIKPLLAVLLGLVYYEGFIGWVTLAGLGIGLPLAQRYHPFGWAVLGALGGGLVLWFSLIHPDSRGALTGLLVVLALSVGLRLAVELWQELGLPWGDRRST